MFLCHDQSLNDAIPPTILAAMWRLLAFSGADFFGRLSSEHGSK
jgi:hypothetical protein